MTDSVFRERPESPSPAAEPAENLTNPLRLSFIRVTGGSPHSRPPVDSARDRKYKRPWLGSGPALEAECFRRCLRGTAGTRARQSPHVVDENKRRVRVV